MKFLLECVILEVTEKHFRNKDGVDQAFYVAQAYQPGIGVAEIGCAKEAVKTVSPGKSGVYAVEIRNGKPRITDVLK